MDKERAVKLMTTSVVAGLGLWMVYKLLRSMKKTIKVYQRKKCIYIVNCEDDWTQFYTQCIQSRDIKVLGLDCEWVCHGSRSPVSLLQLATQNGDCSLVRLSKMEVIPETLRALMQNRNLLKVGVAVRDDAKKLQQDYTLFVRGCLDLRHMMNRVRGIFQCDSMGLQGLAEGVLGFTISKDPSVRRGDWEADTYSEKQIEYAANDALVGVDIFTHLVLAKIRHRRPHLTDSKIFSNEDQFWKTAQYMCQGTIDVNYRSRANPKRTKPSRIYKQIVKQIEENERKTGSGSGEEDEEDDDEDDTSDQEMNREPDVVHRNKEHRAYVVRQRPLYYNCVLLAPDDEMLCTCDVRKAAWYMEQGLADKVKDNPFTVKLRFEPSGRPKDDYYLQDKENICVVCGKTESFIRKCVIPKEYRKYFPPSIKEHSSHDVLLLCVPCHMRSTEFDVSLRQKLADQCSAPIDSGSGIKLTPDEDLRKVKSAAKALMKNKAKANIPQERLLELEKIVKDFYGVTNITDDLLAEGSEINYKVYNTGYVPHGKRVVRYMRRTGGLHEFEIMWRRHFVNSMQPKFMPAKWSIEYKNEHHDTQTSD